MFIIDYHCPYHSIYFEVVQDIKNFNEKKEIVNKLYPKKKFSIKYLERVNLQVLKTICKNFLVNE